VKRDEIKISLVLLAGGKGLRVGADLPKQFLKLKNFLIAEYALKPFLNNPKIFEYVIVCEKAYRDLFNPVLVQNVRFANPGERRQDSLFNGLIALSDHNSLVFVHDAARPFFNPKYFDRLADAAIKYGAAVIGAPIVSTLKEVDKDGKVKKTVDRSHLWEAQTPQVAFKMELLEGLKKGKDQNIVLTDEASIIEFLGKEVKMVLGDTINFKVTVPKDLELAKAIISKSEFYEKSLQTANSL
jgi:2-C-methyl-D-erythritol 4-phosphate cytidylyltransferase